MPKSPKRPKQPPRNPQPAPEPPGTVVERDESGDTKPSERGPLIDRANQSTSDRRDARDGVDPSDTI